MSILNVLNGFFIVTSILLNVQAQSEKINNDQRSTARLSESSIVKSVSVILNGADLSKMRDTLATPDVDVASPINLLNPDRYEFYSFNENGELIKRIMTTPEVQSIVAGTKATDKIKVNEYKIATNGELSSDSSAGGNGSTDVNDIVQNVQNILNIQIQNNGAVKTGVENADDQFYPATFDSKPNETRPIIVIKRDEIAAEITTIIAPAKLDLWKNHSSHNKHNKTQHHHHHHHHRPPTSATIATAAPTVATDPPATDPPATDPPATDPPATDPPATDPPAMTTTTAAPDTTTTMAAPPVDVDPTTTTTAAPDTTTTGAPARDDSAGSGGANNGSPTETISLSVSITNPPISFSKLSATFDSNFSLNKIIESLTDSNRKTTFPDDDADDVTLATTTNSMPAELMADYSTEPISDVADDDKIDTINLPDHKNIDTYSILIPRNKYAANVAAVPPAAGDFDAKHSDQTKKPQATIAPAAGPASGTTLQQKVKGDFLKLARICNDLAFVYWKQYAGSSAISSARSVLLSPFSLSATLAMLYLGARGNTSEELNDILHLDDIVSSNPHQLFGSVYESVTASNAKSQSIAGLVQYLYSDRNEGKMLPFYKEKAFQYYGAIAEEIAFETLYDKLKYSTNTLMKRFADDANNLAREYFKFSAIAVAKPLVAVSANIFQTDCSMVSHSGRDGKMLIHVRGATSSMRRVLSVPAVVWKNDFTIGHDAMFDTTAISLGAANQILRTLIVMPSTSPTPPPINNKPSSATPDVAKQFERFERDFIDRATSRNGWQRVFASLNEQPTGWEVQIPRFTHQSHVNATWMLQQMGLRSLFESKLSDLRGITGRLQQQLYMSDVLQLNSFSVCDEFAFGNRNYVDTYPTGAGSAATSEARNAGNDEEAGDVVAMGTEGTDLPLPLRPREARHPEPAGRLVVDRPFLFYVIHNPTGTILHMGRFYPIVN